jgi:hypothetical protein
MTACFAADARIGEIAEAYALDAVDDAARNLQITLDWTEASIEQVEAALDRLHRDPGRQQAPEETVHAVAKAFGSYIGEVFIRHHGGEWGMVTLNGPTFPGIRAKQGRLFWPCIRALHRLENGPEDNVWHYYLRLSSR